MNLYGNVPKFYEITNVLGYFSVDVLIRLLNICKYFVQYLLQSCNDFDFL